MIKYIIKIIIVCIIVTILAFLIMFCFIKYKTYKINKDAKDIVDKFIKTTKDEQKETLKNDNQDGEYDKKNNKIYYNNNLVIGAIEIPKINISYPIVKEITEESMKNNIVVLYGNLNDISNTVLIGHSYLNGTYFSNIYDLNNGDEIIITDISGKRITYYVYDKFKTDKNDSSFYKRDTNNLREITLSTCSSRSNSNAKRNIVLAKEKSEN